MSVLLATAISFAVFIISDIRQAKSIDDSIGAYYGADAGIERSLYQFRKQNVTSTADLTPKSYDLTSSKVTWSVANSRDTEDVVVRQRLYNGQSVKLFFLGRASQVNNANAIAVTWKKGEQSSNSNMQVTFTQLAPQIRLVDNSLVYYTDQSTLERADSSETGTFFCYGFKDALIDGPGTSRADYVVEIKALGTEGDYIENLKVQAYSTENCSGNSIGGSISNIAIVSEGQKNKSVQKITAQIPSKDPVSGILSFVLFSEEDITKSYE
jgi:hypothetical protein